MWTATVMVQYGQYSMDVWYRPERLIPRRSMSTLTSPTPTHLLSNTDRPTLFHDYHTPLCACSSRVAAQDGMGWDETYITW